MLVRAVQDRGATAIVVGTGYPAAPSGDLVIGFSTSSSFSAADQFRSVNPIDGRYYSQRIIYLTRAQGAPPELVKFRCNKNESRIERGVFEGCGASA